MSIGESQRSTFTRIKLNLVGCWDLKRREGDASNIILTTFGHYLRLVLARLRLLLRAPTGLTALNGAS